MAAGAGVRRQEPCATDVGRWPPRQPRHRVNFRPVLTTGELRPSAYAFGTSRKRMVRSHAAESAARPGKRYVFAVSSSDGETDSNRGHHDFQRLAVPFGCAGSDAMSGFRTSFGTSPDVVARCRYLEGPHRRRDSGSLAGTSPDGETRTRTGDTTIFSRRWLGSARTKRLRSRLA
jgi:hypothetical protein